MRNEPEGRGSGPNSPFLDMLSKPGDAVSPPVGPITIPGRKPRSHEAPSEDGARHFVHASLILFVGAAIRLPNLDMGRTALADSL